MRWFRSELARCLALALITVATYLPTFRNGFVDYDDPIYVTANSNVAAGLTPSSIQYAWTTFDSGNWIPLTWLSYLLDSSLFGVNAVAFHATNLQFHVANVLLVYWTLRRLTGAIGRSAVVAALFAVHPLHVESVAWVSERKDMLSTFWLLLTLLAYAHHAAKPTRGRYLLVCVCMTLGLLCKSMLVSLPILLLLVDRWPLRRVARNEASAGRSPDDLGDFGDLDGCDDPARPWQTLVLEKVPLLLLAFVDGIITMCAQGTGSTTLAALDRLSLSLRIGNAVQAYGWYLAKTFLPVGLSVFYPHPMESLSWARVGMAAVLLVAITLAVLIHGRQREHLTFGWLWFLISLLPVIGLLQVGSQAQADRYSYVAHIGLFTLIAWEAHHWIERLPNSARIATALTVVSVLACTILTHGQVSHWRNTETLFSHALAVDSENYLAHYQLGVLHMREENAAAAIGYFQSALARRPDHVDALNNLGWLHQQRGEWGLAEDCYQRAIRADPKQRRAQNNLNRMKQLQKSMPATGRRDNSPNPSLPESEPVKSPKSSSQGTGQDQPAPR